MLLYCPLLAPCIVLPCGVDACWVSGWLIICFLNGPASDSNLVKYFTQSTSSSSHACLWCLCAISPPYRTMRVGKQAQIPCLCIPFAALSRLCNPTIRPRKPMPPKLPTPLKRRKRALSTDFKGSSNTQLTKIAKSQKDSRLFSLPPELRNQIWIACIGGLKLHFELQMGLLRQSAWGPCGERRKNGLLSLPLSCRRV